jgi:IS4 transposase
MWFHKQCDYLFKFQAKRRINESILLQKWPRNNFDAKNNAYETLVLTYSRNLDLLILANSIIRSNVEEESSPPYPKDVVTN